MAQQSKTYRCLVGRRNLGLTRSSLWLGPDHLLKITIHSYEEHYKRYYFKDIQAVTIQRANENVLINLILIVLIIIMVIISVFNKSILTAAVTIGPLGLLLAVNLLMGTSCKVKIRTAVQTDTIDAVRRMGKAHKLIAQLRPVLLEAQGGFTAEDEAAMAAQRPAAPNPAAEEPQTPEMPETPAQVQPQTEAQRAEAALEHLIETEPVERITLTEGAIPEPGRAASVDAGDASRAPAVPPLPATPPPAPAGTTSSAAAPPPLPPPRVRMAMAPQDALAGEEVRTPGSRFVFSMLALDGLLTLADIFGRSIATVVLNQIMFMAVVISAIVALARLTRVPLTAGLRRTLYWVLGYVFTFSMVSSFWVGIRMAANTGPASSGDPWAMIRWTADQSALDSPFLLIILVLALLLSWGFAFFGFRELRMIHAAGRQHPATDAAPTAAPETVSQES